MREVPRRRADVLSSVGAKWLVWSIWAAMVVGAVGYVMRFGSDVPYWDDWHMVDVTTGTQPVTLQWLWSAYNGHRIPLPRLILLDLYKLTGANFTAGMYFNVAALAAAAAALIWASARMRGGRISLTDSVFPLLLLHWGHFENLLWSWQVTMVLPVAVACAALAVIAAYGQESIPKAGVVLMAVGVLALPMCGVSGLVYAPALAGWVAIIGTVAHRDRRHVYAAVLWAAAALALILVILYFQGYSHTPLSMTLAQWRAALRTSVGFVAGGLGPVGRKLSLPPRAMMAAVLLATLAAVGWTAVRSDQPPFRSRGLLFFLIGTACLVAAFGIGRMSVPAWVGRYFLLAVPIWCATFLAWPLSLKPRVAQLAQAGLLGVLIAITPLNFRAGLLYARDYHGRMEQFRTDLLSGMSPGQLVARHIASLYPCPWWDFPKVGVQVGRGDVARVDDGFPLMDAVSFHGWITGKLRKLHVAKIGDYARMQPDDPPVREIVPSPVSGFTIGHAAETNDPVALEDTAVFVTPDRPLYVAGIRVRRPADCADSSPSDVRPPWAQVFWRLPGESGYTVPHRYVFLWQTGDEEQIVWIFRVIDQIAFHMGNRDVQRRLSAEHLPVTLLVPVESYAR